MRIVKAIGALLVLVLMARPAAAEAPPLLLEKTVGTDESVCAATSAITVTAGTDVTYCYEVTNNSGITLTTHDLFDDQLGSILSGFPYSLVPGASVFLTQTTTIGTTTVNVATWTASTGIIITETARTADAEGGAQGPGAFSASDSCIVSVAQGITETDGGPDGCSDGIDNEPDGTIDCGDADCVGVEPCVSPAPVLGPGGMVVAGLILLSIGAKSFLRRRDQ